MIGAGPAATHETPRPRGVFSLPASRASVPILAGLSALCMAFPGCTKRTKLSEEKFIGHGYVELDSNRVLVSLVHRIEYNETGFMTDRDEAVDDFRYIVLDLADPDPPEPMESHGGHGLSGAVVEGNEVLLNPWNYLDLAEEKVVRTAVDFGGLPLPNPHRRLASADLEPGPGPGLYLVEASFVVDGRFSDKVSSGPEIRQWFVYDRAARTYASLLQDSTGTVLDLAYRDRIPWALHRIDSLTVLHRTLGPAAVERTFTLPDTLTEWEAHIEYDQGPRGLFVKFKCGQCHPALYYWYRDASADSASWENTWTWEADHIMNTLSAVRNTTQSTVKVSRYSDTAESRVFDLSAFLR